MSPRVPTGAFPATPQPKANSSRPLQSLHSSRPSQAYPSFAHNGNSIFAHRSHQNDYPDVKPSFSSSTTSSPPPKKNTTLPVAPQAQASSPSTPSPVIPLTVLDAPTQRLYAFAVYILLWAWRLYDWLQLTDDLQVSSWWLFLKWAAIDCAFFFGLPELRIPWLELSQSMVLTLFGVHAVVNYMMMFSVPLPFQASLLATWRLFYDREIAISEHNVKVSHILHNSSLITGKQIINILPEGTAALNQDQTPFCLGPERKSVDIPFFFNGTVPVEIELARVDLSSDHEEIIKLSRREINYMAKQIKQQMAETESSVAHVAWTTKKTGIYRLHKVLDEYKLEVQRPTRDTFVVECPKATFRTAAAAPTAAATDAENRCLHDLSNVYLDVVGTAPLKIVYGRTINGKDHSFHFQSLQPEGFSSPLMTMGNSVSSGGGNGNGVVGTESSANQQPLVGIGNGGVMHVDAREDHSWIQPARVPVSLNESMTFLGEWTYTIDEVHDALGNVVSYSPSHDEIDAHTAAAKSRSALTRSFTVRERPKAHLKGCNLRNPLRAARGHALELPVDISISKTTADVTSAFDVEWLFSPIDSLTTSGEHGAEARVGKHRARNLYDTPTISEPGLYTLKRIASRDCAGEIEEPSSCILLNPLEPSLVLRAEEIADKCAGNSVGLRVDMDLMGTPPFIVQYDVTSGGKTRRESVTINSLRHQIELRPQQAGHHAYVFRTISDAIYHNQPAVNAEGAPWALHQDVKPAASAVIRSPTAPRRVCMDQTVDVEVQLFGEGPFTLEYEMVHDGRRTSYRVPDIAEKQYRITTEPLSRGGEYVVALNSVSDRRQCRTFLKDEAKISVRRQKPRASFGLLEGKRRVTTVENTKLRIPVRLQGEGPWTVVYRGPGPASTTTTSSTTAGHHGHEQPGQKLTKLLHKPNDFLEVQARGVYELLSVSDTQCPGLVEADTSSFEVDWFPRPELTLQQTASLVYGDDGVFRKADICEGDVDSVDVRLRGAPPFRVDYEMTTRKKGSVVGRRSFDVAQDKASISLDSSKPGEYVYTFHSLADHFYNNDRRFQPVALHQRVNPKPVASFVKPGQSFKFCKEDPLGSSNSDEQTIPIALQGTAPFYVELEIKHQSGSPAEPFTIASIESATYAVTIPRKNLQLGSQQVRIRSVRDARGCQRRYDQDDSPAVQVHLYEAPALWPLETRQDYCVGERIAFSLSGTPPFEIVYDFHGRRVAKATTTSFRRIAESPGTFTITSISDRASECRAQVQLAKTIHALPSVRMSHGRPTQVDIHEGTEVELVFDFTGTPPFEFTYTRSSNARKGHKSTVLETRHEVSYTHRKVLKASLEGTYEVVAIKDHYCAHSSQSTAPREKAL